MRYAWPQKVNLKIWRQVTVTKGHDMPEIGHITYQSMRMDETNTLVLVSSLYLHSSHGNWVKKKKTHTHRRPLVTSDDLVEVTDEKLHLGPHKWPLNVWSWKNVTDPKRFDEDICTFIFTPLTRNSNFTKLTWPWVTDIKNLRIQIVGTMARTYFQKFQIDWMKTLAWARLQSIFEVRSLKVTLWPDLRWPGVKIYTKGAELMTKQLCKIWRWCAPPNFGYREKTGRVGRKKFPHQGEV